MLPYQNNAIYMNFLREHKIEVVIFLLALLVRCVYLGISLQAHDGNLVSTIQGADGYFTVSQNIIAGHGFSDSSQPPYEPYSFRPPLYHYFIAGSYWMFGGYGGVIALQILIGSILPILAMCIVRYLFSRKIEIWTGFILALEPVSILFSTFFYSETLFMLLFFISLLFLFKYFKEKHISFLAYSALSLGLATMTRPTAEYLPVLIIGILFWEARGHISRTTLTHSILYGLVFLTVLSPWLYRNYTLFEEASLSPQVGVNLYANVVPSVLALENGTSYQQEYEALQATGVSGPNETKVGEDQGYTQTALSILFEHPKALAVLAFNTELAFFTHDGVFDVLRHIGEKPDMLLGKPAVFLLFSDPSEFFGFIGYYLTKPAVLILIMRIFWYLITIFFVAGAIRYIRREGITPFAAVALCSVTYFALITLVLGFTINARYRLPVEFLIIPFALYGLVYLKTIWKQFR
jgi:4-amino-4-deoxy-L-arabinose transferase-like glycosyltransferase